jgi:uncharacterized protein (DUF1800 family)
MGKINRREFLEELLEATEPAKPIKEDKIFIKYANQSLPRNLAKTTGTLNSYTGSWTKAEVTHLLRRTTFGVKPADIQTLLAMTPGDAVDYLFSNVPSSAPAPPVNNYYNGGYVDPTGIAAGQTWVNAAYGDGTVNAKRRQSLTAWWMGLILNQNLSILEKMTWFWHNHFATELSVIGDARLGYIHHSMLRANALGNFKTMVKLVTKDPAMLVYLNGQLNTGAAPDENYGRELQELFTVSKYNTPNYIEDDVKAAARVLSGWQINYASSPISAKFTASRHDSSNKQFSTFYNNAIVYGQTGANGANETDALIDMIFNNAATQVSTWICTKLYRFFVYYDTVTDPSVSATVIAGLASLLVSSNWDIVPVVKRLLKSQHFFDTNSQGCYIRTPLDFYAGLYRTFGITLPTSFDTQKTYAIWNAFRQFASDNGLDLGEPPNVSGFPAYYQDPQYHELWINSNTFPKRLQFTDVMLNSGFAAGTGSAIKIDVVAFANGYANADTPDMLIQYFCDILLGVDISKSHKDTLKVATLLSGQTSDYYWTQAWQAYKTTPNTANTNTVKTRLTSLLTELMHLPEHHLA